MFARTARFAVVLVAVASLLAVAPQADAATFRWKFEKGEQFQAVQSNEMKMEISNADQTTKVTTDMEMYSTRTIASVDEEGNAVIAEKIDRIRMVVDAAGQKSEFDSSKPEGEQGDEKLASMMGALVGLEFTSTMTPRGKVSNVKIPEETIEAFGDNPFMKQMVQDGGLGDLIAKASPVLPEGDIERGHKWDQSAEQKTPVGTVKVTSTYTYVGTEPRGAQQLDKFDVAATVSFGGANPLGLKIEMKEQDASGAMYFDNQEGRLVETDLNQSFTQHITGPGADVTQKIEQSVRQKIVPLGKVEE